MSAGKKSEPPKLTLVEPLQAEEQSESVAKRESRTESVAIKLKPSERLAIEQWARLAGKSLPQYIRDVVLRAGPGMD